MGGFEILVMLVGALVGAGAVFWWQENRIKRLERDHKRALRKMAESAERNYAERKSSPLQANMQVAPPSQSQGLIPAVMQGTPAPIPTLPVVPVPPQQRSPEELSLSSAASLPTEPLVDLSGLSDAAADEIEESPFALPEEADDLDLSALSDPFALEAEDLAFALPQALVDLPELADSVAEVAEESSFTPLEETNDLGIYEFSDPTLELPEESTLSSVDQKADLFELSDPTPELPEELTRLPVDQTADLFELSDPTPELPEELTRLPVDQTADLFELSDTTLELPEVLPLTPVGQTADLFELSDPTPELPEELPLTSVDQTADLFELPDTTLELPEVLPLTPVGQTADLFELSNAMPEVTEEITLTIPEQTTEPPLPEAQLQELFEQTPEAQPLITQIFDEPPFEIDEPVAMISSSMASVPAIAAGTSVVTNKITAKIATWGQLANLSYIPQILEYANHPDAIVREQVATGLGQIAAANAMHAYTPQVIPILERLSRDRHLETRYQAIVALGQIKSELVIPILTSALREPSSKLVKAASAALDKMKYYAPSEPKPLELPKQVVYKKPPR